MEFNELENDLVFLRKMEKTDFETLFTVASDKNIWAQHPQSNRYLRDEFSRYFDLITAGNIAYLIVDKASSEIIGATSYYDYDASLRQVAIGYTFLSTQFWGGRYNASIKTLLIENAFRSVDTVIFHVHPMNERSKAALRKIGAIEGEQIIDPDTKAVTKLVFRIDKANYLPRPIV